MSKGELGGDNEDREDRDERDASDRGVSKDLLCLLKLEGPMESTYCMSLLGQSNGIASNRMCCP